MASGSPATSSSALNAPAPPPPGWWRRTASGLGGGLSTAWSYVPAIPGRATATEVQGAAKKVQALAEDPRGFARGMTLGIMDALSADSVPQAGVPGAAPDGAPTTPATLSNRVTQVVMGGVSAASSVVMQKLLENSETYDLDPDDANLRATAIATLTSNQNAQRSLPETAKSVWDTLNKYHIIIGGVNLNVKTSTDEKMREERVQSEGSNNDGVSPIHSLVRCQEAWRTLRTRHALNPVNPSPTIPSRTGRDARPLPTTEESLRIKALEKTTGELVTNFSQKTVHYATMYIIHRMVNHSFDPAVYKKILQDGGDIEEAYLSNFNGPVRRVFYKAAFRLIGWLIRPIIAETIEQVVVHLRKFLNNDVDLLHFVEKKVGDMADYYGRIEKARRDYTEPKREDECGTFDNFLKETIKVYGQKKLTEEQLAKMFGDYIVENFVPRPKIEFFGHRIPLISGFLEWTVHAVRKAIVRHVMKKAGIVQKILTQGTDSVHYAQLGLKRLLQQKLTQVCEMVTRSRSRTVVPIDPLHVGAVPPAPADLETKKAQIISRQLHLIIQQHSSKLLRFIDIESCNGDEMKLADLDNRVSALVAESMTAVSNLFKWEPFSLRKVLEDASTHAMETALLALFEDKGKQIEEQLQTVFGVLEKSYTYVPDGERADREREFLAECAEVDRNLGTLQEQLSRAAVAAALESHLKNVSGERHNVIKAYVQKEKDLYRNFIDELAGLGAQLHGEPSEQNSPALKSAVSKAVSLIEQYLSHISAQLPSPELEACYSDVRGDLHNIYAAAIVHLNELHGKMEQISSAVDMIKATEDELISTQTCETILNNFSLQGPSEAITADCVVLEKHFPLTIRDELIPKLQEITKSSTELKQTAATLAIFDQREERAKLLGAFERKKTLFSNADRQLNSLKLKCREYHDLRGTNNKYPTEDVVESRRGELHQVIQQELQVLRAIKDHDFVREISKFLDVNDTNELYRVFYPSLFASHVPIFSNLASLQGRCQEAILKVQAELAQLPEVPPTRQEIIETQTRLGNQITEAIRQIRERLVENRIAQTMRGDEQKAAIGVSRKAAFEERFAAFRELGEHFAVKGCISVGEIKLYNRLAPELTARIAPEIIKGTRTMIDAMGKPFHYKQLVLRLLFLDIADRHKASTE